MGGHADHPPLFGNQKSVKALPEMPRIFSFRLQCGGEGAPCGRGQGAPTASPPGWDAKSDWPLDVSTARHGRDCDGILHYCRFALLLRFDDRMKTRNW